MRGLSNSTKELIEYAYRLLVADHPQTLRQLHYAVFSRREIPYENDQADYKRLSRATSVACRAYRAWELESGRDSDGDPPAYSIPADWMVDETRQPETVSVWRDATQYVETVKRSYRRDNWQDQANYCEVWKKRHSWAPSGPSRTPGASRYGCATDSAAPVGAPPCPHSSSHYSSLSYCALPRALKLRKSVGRNLPSTSLCCPGRFELLLSNSVPQAPSITSPVILVGRTRRGNAAGRAPCITNSDRGVVTAIRGASLRFAPRPTPVVRPRSASAAGRPAERRGCLSHECSIEQSHAEALQCEK